MENNAKKNLKGKILLSVIILSLYFMFSIIVNEVYNSFFKDTQINKMLLEFIFNACLLIGLIIIYKRTFLKDIKIIMNKKLKYIWIAIKYGVLIFIISFIIVIIKSFFFPVVTEPENTQYLLSNYKNTPIILIFLTILYYPIVEGIVFRKTVRDVIESNKAFIIFSALIYWFLNIIFITINIENFVGTFYCFINMAIVSYVYVKHENFSLSILVQMVYSSMILIIKLL